MVDYKALAVVAKMYEKVVGGIKKDLTDQLKQLPVRPSKVQSCRKI